MERGEWACEKKMKNEMKNNWTAIGKQEDEEKTTRKKERGEKEKNERDNEYVKKRNRNKKAYENIYD